MQNLVPASAIASNPMFSEYQGRTVERLSSMPEVSRVVPIPEKELSRSKKGPVNILFYDADNKLHMWKVGSDRVLDKKIAR